MSKSLFTSRHQTQNRLPYSSNINRFGSFKRSVNQNINNGFIDLGWLGTWTEKLDNFANVSTFFYQLIALSLLTVGMFLSYQSFNNLKIADNSVALAKEEIKKSNEKRIWTDSNSIDKGLTPLQYSIAPSQIAITQIVAKNECSNKIEKIQDKISENQKVNLIDRCETANSNGIKDLLIPNKVIAVKSGDTFSSISKEQNTTTKYILELNNLNPDSKLKIGQQLLIKSE